MNEVPLYELCLILFSSNPCIATQAIRGEGVICDPQQVVGPYVWPTVGAYDPTRRMRDIHFVDHFASEGGIGTP